MNFTLQLRPVEVTTTRQQWWNVIAHIPLDASINYDVFAIAANAPKEARAGHAACATNPLPTVYSCHWSVHKDGTIGHYNGGGRCALNHTDSAAFRAFLVDYEKNQQAGGPLILT